MGHDSTSLGRVRGLRRPAPRVSWPTPEANGRHDLTLTMMNTGPACRYRNSPHTARGRPLSSNPTMTFARVPRRQSGGFRRPIIRTAARRSPAGFPTSTLEPGMPVLLDGPSRDCKDCSPAGAWERTSRLGSVVRAPPQAMNDGPVFPVPAAVGFGSARPLRSPALVSEPTIGGEPAGRVLPVARVTAATGRPRSRRARHAADRKQRRGPDVVDTREEQSVGCDRGGGSELTEGTEHLLEDRQRDRQPDYARQHPGRRHERWRRPWSSPAPIAAPRSAPEPMDDCAERAYGSGVHGSDGAPRVLPSRDDGR